MDKTITNNRRLILLSIFMIFLCSSCVNEIESEISPGTVPIKFSTSISKTNTRTTGDRFDQGDLIGLFATLSETSVNKQCYISNLKLECGKGSLLTPEKEVFYPEGGTTLDFISYYPYQKEGLTPQSSSLTVTVQTDQSISSYFTKSDFLIARKEKVTSSNDAVALSFLHQFAKLKIELLLEEGEDIDEMLRENPRIIASGFYTQADYDLQTGKISNYNTKSDIVSSGSWRKEDKKLIGKEIIVIPQEVSSDEQFFTIDWNGKMYTCPISIESLDNSSQCKISLKVSQDANYTFTGIVGKIEDWGELTEAESEGNYQITSIHIAALSFSTSSIYRVYQQGKAVAEICKEYLLSDESNIASKAIVVYPVIDEQAQLGEGVVLQLLDKTGNIHGGSIIWDITKNTLAYTSGTSKPIEEFYIDSEGKISLTKPDSPSVVNVSSYMLRDIRAGHLETYPIVKIGTQYWMREDLKATTYQDGTEIPEKAQLDAKAGYFKNKQSFFYNGEAILTKKLLPENWKIPSKNDWDLLRQYIKNDIAVLKTGDWIPLKQGDTVFPATNETGLSFYPHGVYTESGNRTALVNESAAAFYWIGDDVNGLTETVIFMKSTSNDIDDKGSNKVKDKDYYIAVPIRCIKE